MKDLSVVIPVYNSQKTIEEVVGRTENVLNELERVKEFEVILVNDGSEDNVLDICKRISKNKEFVKVINLSKNFGQHHALMAGFDHVNGDYVVCLDDDLQNPPKEIPKLFHEIENKDLDVVFAEFNDKKHSFLRNLGSYFNDLTATWLIDKPKELYISSFFIAKRYVIDQMSDYEGPYPYVPGLVFRITKKIANVEVQHRKRAVGGSNYSFIELVSLWLNGFTNFSVKPLRISGILGASFSGIGFLIILVIVIRRLLDPSVQMGWTSLMGAVIFFGGVQLISLGLLGEYIGRIFIHLNKSPQYVIKNRFNFDDTDES